MNPPKVTQRFIEINATRNGHNSMARVRPAGLKAARLFIHYANVSPLAVPQAPRFGRSCGSLIGPSSELIF